MKAIDPNHEKTLHLAEVVAELVVNVFHPDLYEGRDIWWRQDYEEFIEDHPEAAEDFEITPASLDDVDGYIEVMDLDRAEFNIWSEGMIRNRYAETE